MKKLLIIILLTQIGCSTIGDLAVQSVAGIIGGAVGNMADRRIEEKLQKEKELKKEKNNDCANCEVDKR